MRKTRRTLIAALLLAALPVGVRSLPAQTLSVSGNPAILRINSAAFAGGQPTPVTNSSTTYSIGIIALTRKITASLNSNMPAGTTLELFMNPPLLGTSAGYVTLSTTAQTTISLIAVGAALSGMTMTYRFSANVSAGIISPTSRTVTLTIVSYP